MTRGKMIVLAAFFFMATFACTALAAENEVLRQAQDRAQIERLMWRYVRALDSGDSEAYAATFTPDGQFGRDANATKGRDALKKMIIDMRRRNTESEANGTPRRPPMYHVITNSYIEFIDGDHARFHAYWMTVFGAGGENTPPRVAAAGRELDELVRFQGEWLIKLRDVNPSD
jgi:uncharacterized protein (TIGR02246 family)